MSGSGHSDNGYCTIQFNDSSCHGCMLTAAIFKEDSFGRRECEKWVDMRETNRGFFIAGFRIPGKDGMYNIDVYDVTNGAPSGNNFVSGFTAYFSH